MIKKKHRVWNTTSLVKYDAGKMYIKCLLSQNINAKRQTTIVTHSIQKLLCGG